MKKLTWYHELGFYNNPLSIKPAAFHNEIMGYDKIVDEINKKITESNIILVTGEYGTGKSTVLKKIINQFRGKRRVIYYNCDQSEKAIDFDRLLINAGGLFRRLFRIRKKDMILLLDEIEYLNMKDMNQIKEYYDEDFFKSVVLVSCKEDVKLTEELKELIEKNRFKLGKISQNEAVELIRERIGDLKLISDEMIIKVFGKNPNPRAFLKNCEEVCRYAFEQGAETVSEEHINKALV